MTSGVHRDSKVHNGDVHIGSAKRDTADGVAGLDASSKQVPAQHFVGVPATAGAAGVAGQMAYASGFLYICVAANTWEKATIATW